LVLVQDWKIFANLEQLVVSTLVFFSREILLFFNKEIGIFLEFSFPSANSINFAKFFWLNLANFIIYKKGKKTHFYKHLQCTSIGMVSFVQGVLGKAKKFWWHPCLGKECACSQ
jgi:hypothetical protein